MAIQAMPHQPMHHVPIFILAMPLDEEPHARHSRVNDFITNFLIVMISMMIYDWMLDAMTW
jgi:hypothetical protein